MSLATSGEDGKLHIDLIVIAILRAWRVWNHFHVPAHFPVFQPFDRASPYMTLLFFTLSHFLIVFFTTCALTLALEATTRKYEGTSCHRWRKRKLCPQEQKAILGLRIRRVKIRFENLMIFITGYTKFQ